MTDRLPVYAIDTAGADATNNGLVYNPITDAYEPGPLGTSAGGGAAVSTADATIDHPLGLNLTKLGIVIPKGASGAWDSILVESPSVMYDPKSGRWVMVYVGYGTTSGAQRPGAGLAYSDDGITWTKSGSAAMLPHSGTAGAPDQNGVSGPVLLWDNANAQYVLYYIGLTSTGYEAGTKTICMATATSLAGPWTRHGVAIAAQASTWRDSAVWHASIVERDGTWYMFFNAGSNEKIGYATAPAITGPWTVDDVNSPLISAGSGWESGHVGDPSVRRVGDMWVMDYYGVASGFGSASDGIAITTDHDFPLGWVKHTNNPILAPGASYDAKYAHKPFVLTKAGVLFHYYTAVAADDTRQIALAVEYPPSATGVPAPAPTLTVQDENSNVATEVTQLDFQGAGVTVTAGTGEAVVTIPGGSVGSTALVPLTTTVGGVPQLVWDENDNLVMTEVPL